MNVNIHFFGVTIEEQQGERIAGRRHQVVIRRRQRVQKQLVADQPAIDEQEDRVAIQLLDVRTGNESAQTEHTRFLFLSHFNPKFAFDVVEIYKIVKRLPAEHLVDALTQALDRSDIQKIGGAVA